VAKEMGIGAAARAARCSVPTLRYYEQIGLIDPANRTASGHRTYDRTDIDRLILIRRCRDFGMPIKDVADLINVQAMLGDCDDALTLINSHRGMLRARIAELKALERTLAIMGERCAANCLGGRADCCTIFDDLAARD
jgi:MerR family transcriptional regulator, copper efflux regulator